MAGVVPLLVLPDQLGFRSSGREGREEPCGSWGSGGTSEDEERGEGGKARWESRLILHWSFLLKHQKEQKEEEEEGDKGLDSHKSVHRLLFHLWGVVDGIVVVADDDDAVVGVVDVLEKVGGERDKIVVSSCTIQFHCFRW